MGGFKVIPYFEIKIKLFRKTFPTNNTEVSNLETQLSLHKLKLCDFYRSPSAVTAATYRPRWTPHYASKGDIRNAHQWRTDGGSTPLPEIPKLSQIQRSVEINP
jgi:hypothetical protein